jgi:2-polyprenyl-3-methyl-5-hydroxy-6-metoxy-1,4-benzoquinol methylase
MAMPKTTMRSVALPTDKVEIINKVVREIAETVSESTSKDDASYFFGSEQRFKRTIRRISELSPEKGRILDIGSLYLHLSSALSLLGYDVVGVDVPEFADQSLVKARSAQYNVSNHADRIEQGTFLPGFENRFDVVVFTEIMEHITFNPVLFWRRIYELMKVKALIYMTTPNSITLWNVLHTLKNLITRRGIGLSPFGIFCEVTYGHHWKEYSGREIREYFSMLSPDFSVEIDYYNLPTDITEARARSMKSLARDLVHWASSCVPSFQDQLEAIVRLQSRTTWLIEPPDLASLAAGTVLIDPKHRTVRRRVDSEANNLAQRNRS